MRLPLIVLLLSAALTAPGQNSNVAPSAPPKEDPAKTTLHARVFYEDTGAPVRRTSVMLITKERNGREISGVTDGHGNLVIPNVRAGKYFAIVNAPGVVSPFAYVDIRKNRDDTFEDVMQGFPAIFTDGLTDVEVQIPARRGGAISGRVTYPDGEAAIGVKVEVLRKTETDYIPSLSNLSVFSSMMNGGAGMFITDDRGYFRVAGLPAGDYIVKVSENVQHSSNPKPSYGDQFDSLIFGKGSLVSFFFENAFDRDKAVTIPVGFGQETAEIKMVIPDRELHTLKGRVLAAQDKLPVRNSTVHLQRVGDDVGGTALEVTIARQDCLTDDKGSWSFNELPKGTYRVFAEADGAVLDAEKQAYGYSANAANTAANREAYGYMNRGEKPTPKKFAKKITEITIEDKDVDGFDIALDFGSTFAGTVTADGDGKIPLYFKVVVSNEKPEISSSVQVYVDDYEGLDTPPRKFNRDFMVEGITSGMSYLTIEGSRDYYIKSAVSGSTDLLKDGFEIKEGSDLRDVKIVMASDVGTLKGTIVTSDKDPVSHARVSLVPTDAVRQRNTSFHRTVTSGDLGEFEVRLPPMEYSVVFFPADVAKMSRKELMAWLAEATRSAQKITIESGTTSKITIKHDPGKPK